MANIKLIVFSITIFTIWLFICTIIYIFYLDFINSTYFRYGPSDNLYVIGLGIYVNTWRKYSLLIIYSFINPLITFFATDNVYPWITSVIMNHDAKIIDVDKSTAWVLTNYMWTITSFSTIFSVGIGMTQIDFMIAANLGCAVSGMVSSYFSIRNKIVKQQDTNVNENENENENKLDQVV